MYAFGVARHCGSGRYLAALSAYSLGERRRANNYFKSLLLVIARYWIERNEPGRMEVHPSHLFEVPLHDKVLDIRTAHHEPLALLKVDRPKLSLYDTTIAHARMDIARRVRDRRRDVELRREVSAEIHDRCIILAQVPVCEQQRAPERPIHVLEEV